MAAEATTLAIDFGSWHTKIGHVDSVPLKVPSLVCEVPIKVPQLRLHGRRELPPVMRTLVGEAVQSAILSDTLNVSSTKGQSFAPIATGADSGNIITGSEGAVCPFEGGRITDWNNFELMFNHICTERLEVALDLQPIALCVPTMCTPKEIQHLCELCFEAFNVPRLTLMSQDLAAAHSHPGSFTGVVVNIGHSITRLAGVVDGCLLHGVAADLPVAGKALGDCFASLITSSLASTGTQTSNKRAILPKIGVLEGDIWWQTLKEKTKIRVADDISEEAYIELQCDNDDAVDNNPVIYGGVTPSVDSIGEHRFDRRRELKKIEDDIRSGVHRTAIESALAAECFFNPAIVNYLVPACKDASSVPSSQRSLPDMIDRLIQQCPIDYRRQMYNGVLVVGGGANLVNLCRRLQSSLRRVHVE
eukprot:Lankesteria_metandrocarpae@DN5284_c2_g1_i3.p1